MTPSGNRQADSDGRNVRGGNVDLGRPVEINDLIYVLCGPGDKLAGALVELSVDGR